MSPTHASPPATRIISCKTSADLLAALPQLTGFTADDSIFVLLFDGKRTSGCFRLDLPVSEDDEDTEGLPDAICDVLEDLGDLHGTTSAPAVVITCSQTFERAGGAPWSRLAERIERRLRERGPGVRDLCCLAADGWVSYLDPSAPSRGRPLGEISENPISLDAGVNGRLVPDLASLGRIPRPDPARLAAVAAALEALPAFPLPGPEPVPPPRSGSAEPAIDTGATFTQTAAVARSLMRVDGALSPRMTARLIRSAASPDRWLQLALAVLTRPDFPGELARDLGPERFIGVPVDIDGPNTAAGATGPRRTGWSIRRILFLLCPDFTDRERLPDIRDRLLTAISETPTELRPPLLAFSAWVWWLAGSQTVAGRQVREARDIDPEDALTAMVARLIRTPCFYRPSGELSVGALAGTDRAEPRNAPFTRPNAEAA